MKDRFSHGGNVYDVPPASGEWLDFSANINPLGLSPQIMAAIQGALPQIIHYPDPAGRELKRALAEYYQLPSDAIALGNGAAEFFYVFFHGFRPRRVLLPIPSFSEYERAARAAGAEVVYYPLLAQDSFRLSVDSLARSLADVDCVILGNPNNPTGNLLYAEELALLVEAAEKTGAMVVVDESFLDFRIDEEKYTVRPLLAEKKNLLLLRSLTKFYAIPGLRLGFAAAAPELIRRLEENKDPWNVNLLAQKAGVAALSDREYQLAAQAFVRQEKQWLAEELKGIDGITIFEPTVNFILFHVAPPWPVGRAVCEALRQRGILLRDCANYPGLEARYLRTAVRTREENRRFIAALHEVAGEYR